MTSREYLQALDRAWTAWHEARQAVRWLRVRCPEATEALTLARQDRADHYAEYKRLRAAL